MVLGAAFLGCEDECNLLGVPRKAERSGCVVEALLRVVSFLVNQDGGIILVSQKTRKKKKKWRNYSHQASIYMRWNILHRPSQDFGPTIK